MTFLTTRWTARPGEETTFEDHREKLAPVPGLMGFDERVRAFDFRTTAFEIKIKDPANALLWEPTQDAVDEWGPDAEGDEGEATDENLVEENPVCERDWSVIPQDEAETRVAALVHADEVDSNEPGSSEGVNECDICGSKLDGKGLFVDGRRRDVALWANMCAACYEQRGAGVGWGVGQLYARQADGSWRLVAGFRG